MSKLVGKAAKASELAHVANASTDPKGGDLCEARNRERGEIEGSHVPDRSRGARMCVDPGYEHKEKPSGASTDRKADIAERLGAATLFREGERAWGNKSKTIARVKE